MPGDAVDDGAADDRAERDPEPADARPDPQRDPAAARGERLGEQGQRERRHQRAAGALERTRRDQRADARRQRGRGRAEREDGQPEAEHAPPAETVAERGAGEQQHREAQRVGVDGPLEAVDAAAELAVDAGQRGGDHEVVEGDHEQRRGDQGQGPAGASRGGHGQCSLLMNRSIRRAKKFATTARLDGGVGASNSGAQRSSSPSAMVTLASIPHAKNSDTCGGVAPDSRDHLVVQVPVATRRVGLDHRVTGGVCLQLGAQRVAVGDQVRVHSAHRGQSFSSGVAPPAAAWVNARRMRPITSSWTARKRSCLLGKSA